ncbi:FAD synthetase family protein [Aquibacillus sediminis]|uniref:FAD synthetase family protein n=1 Tax=Aquibacillus sediminis TaxID=2574734 RepID=UPI0014868DCE|nr:FAD synthetase family protein [Aquibacillus sediminis]
MEVVYLNHSDDKVNVKPHVMAVGFFDGIHKGHQALLSHAKQLARDANLSFTAMTFSPHPDVVLKGDTNRKYIMLLQQKIRRMEAMGVDKLFVIHFDRSFASLPPSEFITKYIVDMNTRHIVVGFDFTFGFKALGNTNMLRRESIKQSFGLSVIPKKTYLKDKISSTLVRELISKGEMNLIPSYLGTNYQIQATLHVTKANQLIVKPTEAFLLPKSGAYDVEISQHDRKIRGIYHCYTDSEDELDLSASLLDMDQVCSIEFLARIETTRSVSI